MKAIIVGGGIGGLTAALMLRARGIDCELFEQAETIRELGVGINTLPHAIRELAGIGLLDRLDEVAIRTDQLFYLTRHGQQVWHEKRGLDAGHDVPQFSIHRGRLQGVIHQAVVERLGTDAIRTGCRLGSFTQDEGGVTAYFFDRSGAHVHTTRADILIGADGIHSKVRQTLFADEGLPMLERLDAVARGDRLAGVPDRKVHGHRWRFERQGGGLSDRRRFEPCKPPDQLGGAGAGRRRHHGAGTPRRLVKARQVGRVDATCCRLFDPTGRLCGLGERHTGVLGVSLL
jgi:2-polyprenyl-6-methoxyphenol hydroxylase-like FAD-dependent oxidoreductase